VKQTDIAEFVRGLGIEASDAQVSMLLNYEEKLVERGGDLGLISRQDRERVRDRHILDCVRAAAPSPSVGLAYDLGSGGGLPGVVVAILRPELKVKLVERRALRAAFLEWIADELPLPNVEVSAGRIEDVPRGLADVCFARALASLPESWALASGLLKPGGRLIYFAGGQAELPGSLPDADSIRVLREKVLESAGPLAIITR